MQSDWDSVRLGDFCSKIGSGSTPRGGSSVYLEDGEYALFRSQNVLNNAFSSNGLVFIDTEAAEKLKNVSIEKDDVLLNITGDSVARVCKAPSEYLPARVNQHVAIIRTNQDELNSSYVNYCLNSRSMQNYMLSLASAGATRNALTKVMIENFDIPKPPIDIQKKIAHILSTLDDKIELNRKMNQTLEEMAQALFKSWFVDFDPVHAKANAKSGEALECAAAELGISKEVLELFPNEFEESEMGMIPKGWEVKALHSLVKQLKPGTNYQPKRVESGIPFVNGKHIQNGFLSLKDIKYITEEEYSRVHKSWKPEAYDVLITRIGTLGKVGVILETDLPLALHYNSIDIKTDILSHQFLYFLLKSDFFQKQFHLNKKQAVQEFITIDAVEKLKIILPTSRDDLRILSLYFSNIFNMIENNSVQIKSLQKTRDTLLPKLLSGELDVSEIEVEKTDIIANVNKKVN